MTHTINGKEYSLQLTGTVGIVYQTQRLLGHAPDTNDGYDMAAVLYTAVKKSNKADKNFPTLDDFIDGLTTKALTALSSDFWAQWQALEGAPDEAQPSSDEQPDKKGEN